VGAEEYRVAPPVNERLHDQRERGGLRAWGVGRLRSRARLLADRTPLLVGYVNRETHAAPRFRPRNTHPSSDDTRTNESTEAVCSSKIMLNVPLHVGTFHCSSQCTLL